MQDMACWATWVKRERPSHDKAHLTWPDDSSLLSLLGSDAVQAGLGGRYNVKVGKYAELGEKL